MAASESPKEVALQFPLDHVRERYQQRNKVPAEIAMRDEQELKRYLVLCSLHPEVSLPVPPSLDDFWHEFLLHTRDYAEFCGKLGSGFIHHVPSDGSAPESALPRLDVDLVNLYTIEFRETPPRDVWAPVMELGNCRANKEIDDLRFPPSNVTD